MSSKEIKVGATAEQLLAWSEAAGEQSLDAWLAELADDAAAANQPRSWPVMVTLKYPVDFGSERITTLEVRRGRLGDLKDLKIGGELVGAQLLGLVSKMCAQPMKVVESLDPEDAGKVVPLALGFFKTCLVGGRKR